MPRVARANPDPALDGVLYPALGEIAEAFRAKFAARYRCQPDYTAGHAYDAASLLIAAIREAGLNRARIRGAVRALSPYPGVTGTIQWDALGQNQRPVALRIGALRSP